MKKILRNLAHALSKSVTIEEHGNASQESAVPVSRETSKKRITNQVRGACNYVRFNPDLVC
jgi:hypothetical protein